MYVCICVSVSACVYVLVCVGGIYIHIYISISVYLYISGQPLAAPVKVTDGRFLRRRRELKQFFTGHIISRHAELY